MKDIVVPYRVGFGTFSQEVQGPWGFVVAQLIAFWGIACVAFFSFRPFSDAVGWILVVFTIAAASLRTAFLVAIWLIWHRYYGRYASSQIVFTTTGIYLENEHGRRCIAWDSIACVKSGDSYYTLDHGRPNRLFVLIQALREEDRLDDFLSLIKDKTEKGRANQALQTTRGASSQVREASPQSARHLPGV